MRELVTYVIRLISGENNHWDTLLSRWRILEYEGLLVRSNIITVVPLATGDCQTQSERDINDR